MSYFDDKFYPHTFFKYTDHGVEIEKVYLRCQAWYDGPLEYVNEDLSFMLWNIDDGEDYENVVWLGCRLPHGAYDQLIQLHYKQVLEWMRDVGTDHAVYAQTYDRDHEHDFIEVGPIDIQELIDENLDE